MILRFAVLKGDGFDSIATAVEEGRVYDTIEDSESFIRHMQNSVDNGVLLNVGYYVIIPVYEVKAYGEDGT